MMPEDVFLSIIVPAYNEEKNVSDTLSEMSKYLKGKDFNYEVIVIDDGSSDSTVQKASRFTNDLKNFKIIESTPNKGKGYVLKKAMLQAGGEFVMFMDADSSVSIKELENFLPLLKGDSDVYIASRRIPGAKVSVPFKREILGKIYLTLAKMFLGINVNDVNCGFKVFKREAAKNIFSRQVMNDWSFDAEDLFLAAKFGYKVKEIPVEWVYKSTSKVRPLRDGVNSFLSLVRIRLSEFKGNYR
jgi:glycosyltransferase involved in cell wall biosynthesis